MNRMLEAVLRQRGLVLVLLAGLAAWGVASWRRVPLDAYPELTNNQVQILTPVPGMSPVEVEKLVTYPIEIAMTSLPGVQENRSLSQFGLSVVTLIFEEDVDPYFARQLVFERLSRVKDELHPSAEPSLAPLSTALGEVYQYAVVDAPDDDHHYTPTELRTIQDWMLVPELRTVPGVVEVNSLGGFMKQFHVRFDPDRLVAYDITIDEQLDALRRSNANAGGQYIVRNDQQYVVRGVGLIGADEGDILEDIRDTVVANRDGTPVLVRDLAQVRPGHAVRHGAASMNGRGETVVGIVMMRRGANAQEVVRATKDRIDELEGTLPPGIRVEPFYDRNDLTAAAISTVTDSLLIGGALVIAVLVFFLGDARSALIVSLVLPMTALATFVLMERFGLTANLMSLAGLAIGLGMFVDGAIVMVENIHRHRREQPDRPLVQTVFVAGREVMRPVAFAVGVVIAVFLPLFTLERLEGRMFRPMAFTVAFALLAALGLAFTLAPTLGSFLLGEAGKGEGRLSRASAWFVDRLVAGYRPLLRWALRLRIVVAGLAALAVGGGAWLFTGLGGEFAPDLEEGSVAIQVVLEPDAALATSTDVQRRVEEALLAIDEVDSAVSKTGRPAVATDPMGQNTTDMFVGLAPREDWSFEDKEGLVDAMRARLDRIPGVTTAFTQPIALRLDEMISGAKSDIALEIYGSDLGELRRIQREAARAVRDVEGATDVLPSQIAGFGYVEATVRRAEAARYGLDVQTIQDAVRMAVGGEATTEILDGDRRFALVGKLAEDDRDTVEDIRALPLVAPSGARLRLSDVADVRLARGPAEVGRKGGQRKVTLGVNVSGRDTAGFVQAARAAVESKVDLPPGYSLEWGGQFESQQRANQRLLIIVPVTVVLVGLLLFMAFGAWRQATLVLLNVPLSLVGGVVCLWAMDLSVSVPASVGFIAVLGLAVQNGIVMVSFVDDMREDGRSVAEAVREGAALRLRPILMTTLTTLLGLLPLLFASGIGANLQRPLAAVVVGGLFTLLPSTLLLLPSLYAWLEPSLGRSAPAQRALDDLLREEQRA